MIDETGLPWYAKTGFDEDVIISSRVRLARNLANFPFPSNFKGDDASRVQSLIFDAFAQIQEKEDNITFHAVNTKELDEKGRRILEERGVLKSNKTGQSVSSETGLVMSHEGSLSTLINFKDHIRISSFKAGLDLKNTFAECSLLDQKLQKCLQFAASYDFGYLTQSFKDTGSGMKLSARIFIPAIIRTGKLNTIVDFLSEKNIAIKPAFPDISQGSAAGSFYLIHSTGAMSGSELDQIADFESACMYITESERKILTNYADNKRTVVFNSVIRSYSIAKFSLLVSLMESVELISDLMVGLQCGFLSGIDQKLLCGLLFRVQPSHLFYLLESGKFSFEKDILKDERAKIDRLRALILQEAIQKISLGNL